jgi:DNA invertase Pin-like site-specific DNA recombinase
MSDSTPPRAYSYVRFSTAEQAQGDSLRRQTAAAADWCKRNNVTLDTATTLHALGESAFTGKHRSDPERNALAGFLKLVEAGRIPKGSYLIVENMDRLSRELPVHATHLLTGILVKGVRVVQLKPNELILTDRSNLFDLLQGQLGQARGHDESATKSERIGAAWRRKKEAARAKAPQPPRRKDGRVTVAFSGRLPAWVRDSGGKLVAVRERVKVVKQIFRWAAEGFGQVAIVKKLEAAKVAPFFAVVRRRDKGDPDKVRFVERPGRWTAVYVKILLHDRRTLGEFQLRTRDGAPDGDAVKGYFPVVLTEAEFDAARAGCAGRDRLNGKHRRQGKHLDPFKGLVRDARDGSTLVVITRSENGGRREAKLAARRKGAKRDLPIKRSAEVKHTRHLANLSSTQGHAACVSFPLPVFEGAVLGEMAEIDPREVLNGDRAPAATVGLSAQLAGVEARIGDIQAELLEGDVAAAMGALRQLEARRKDLNEKLAEARREEAHPLAESWGELRGLVAKPGGEERRVRLRSVLRRIVAEVWVLTVPQGRDRWAVVQVYFKGPHEGRRRTYAIYHRPPRSNGRVRSEAATFSHSVTEEAGSPEGLRGLDLRKPKDVAKALRDSAGWMADIYAAYLKTVVDASA